MISDIRIELIKDLTSIKFVNNFERVLQESIAELLEERKEKDARIEKLEALVDAAIKLSKKHGWCDGLGQCVCPEHDDFNFKLRELNEYWR